MASLDDLQAKVQDAVNALTNDLNLRFDLLGVPLLTIQDELSVQILDILSTVDNTTLEITSEMISTVDKEITVVETQLQDIVSISLPTLESKVDYLMSTTFTALSKFDAIQEDIRLIFSFLFDPCNIILRLKNLPIEQRDPLATCWFSENWNLFLDVLSRAPGGIEAIQKQISNELGAELAKLAEGLPSIKV